MFESKQPGVVKCYVSSASEDFVSFSILDPETLSSELPSEQLSSELSHQRTVFIRLWERWCIHGPKGARFNRTHSGWFESYTFLDWLMTVFLPAAKKQTGPKCRLATISRVILMKTLCQPVKEITFGLYFCHQTAHT